MRNLLPQRIQALGTERVADLVAQLPAQPRRQGLCRGGQGLEGLDRGHRPGQAQEQRQPRKGFGSQPLGFQGSGLDQSGDAENRARETPRGQPVIDGHLAEAQALGLERLPHRLAGIGRAAGGDQVQGDHPLFLRPGGLPRGLTRGLLPGQQVAERLWPGHDWVDAYERLKDDHPPADGIKAAYQQAMDAARAFVHERRVVTLPERERVITVDTPPAMRRSSPFGTFDTVEPFGDGLVGRLVLTPIERWLSPEQRAERLRSHHRAWIPIIAVHEAYPGHHAHAIKARESPRPLRRVLQEPITLEGWGLFTEQLMFELGFLRGDDVRLTMLRNRLWRAARVILDVSLHTGRMQVDEAVDFLVDRVRFERYAAELEVGMYPRRPTYVLGYLVGMQEIDALRRDWIAAHGEPDPPAALWDAFLSAGGIPPALIRAELLGGPIPGE